MGSLYRLGHGTALASAAPSSSCIGVERWSREDKLALAKVARAKGGRRETDYMRLFNEHKKLRRALLKLAARDYEPV